MNLTADELIAFLVGVLTVNIARALFSRSSPVDGATLARIEGGAKTVLTVSKRLQMKHYSVNVRILVLILSLAAVCACASTQAQVGKRTIHRSRPNMYDVQATYPYLKTHSLLAALANRTLARWVRAQQTEFVTETLHDLTPTERKFAPQGYSFEISTLSADDAAPRFFSVCLETYEDTGGAHPNSSRSTFNFELIQGQPRRLTLGDLFRGGRAYRARVAAALRAKLRQDPRADELSSVSAFTDQELNNFLVEPGGLRFCFDPYEVGSYAAGPIDVVLTPRDLGPGFPPRAAAAPLTPPMKRVLIIGSGGAGKSTLARGLGEGLGITVVHLDSVYWQPGWVESPPEDFDRRLEGLLAQEAWIMDGNYGRTLARRVAAADTIIFLDFPRALCLRRVVQRSLRYRGRTRPDMGAGCPEKWPDLEFLSWIWNYPARSRPGILALLEQHREEKRVFRLASPAAVTRFLQGAIPEGGA